MQEESLRTPKPGADESDGSAPPSTEKQTSAAAFLAPYNPPPLPPLPPLPLPPVGGTMAPAAPPTTLVAAVGAGMPAPRPDHALLGLAPLAPEGEPINPIAHMIAKGGAHEHPIPVDDCRWAKAGESVILMITTDFAFTPDALITSIRAAIIKLKGDPNMMLPEINYVGRQKALFAATALVANLILRDGEIPVFKTEANDDTVGTGEVKLMRPDGAPYPDTEERLVRQELYAERKGRTSILYVQFPRPYLTFDPQRRLITINQTTEYITKFFTSPECLVINGGTLAEDVAAVPLFTALGYPEPQLRFHIRRPPSIPAPEVFFAQFNLAALKFFDIGCHGEACKTHSSLSHHRDWHQPVLLPPAANLPHEQLWPVRGAQGVPRQHEEDEAAQAAPDGAGGRRQGRRAQDLDACRRARLVRSVAARQVLHAELHRLAPRLRNHDREHQVLLALQAGREGLQQEAREVQLRHEQAGVPLPPRGAGGAGGRADDLGGDRPGSPAGPRTRNIKHKPYPPP